MRAEMQAMLMRRILARMRAGPLQQAWRAWVGVMRAARNAAALRRREAEHARLVADLEAAHRAAEEEAEQSALQYVQATVSFAGMKLQDFDAAKEAGCKPPAPAPLEMCVVVSMFLAPRAHFERSLTLVRVGARAHARPGRFQGADRGFDGAVRRDRRRCGDREP